MDVYISNAGNVALYFWYHQLFFLLSLEFTSLNRALYSVMFNTVLNSPLKCLPGMKSGYTYVLEHFILHSYFKGVSILNAAVPMYNSHFC